MMISGWFLLLAMAGGVGAFAADSTPPKITSGEPAAPAPAGVRPLSSSKADAQRKPLKISIGMRDVMRFDPPRFEATPGGEIEVSLENADTTHQPHNFLVLRPGKREEVVKQAMELGDKGPAQDYIPVNPQIIVHSELMNPESEGIIRFKLPEEKGIYPYVCTMPGHGMIMYGAIYAGVKMPPLAKDENIPPQATQAATPGGGRRPYIQRIFMPNAGPAAIAVALPGEQNYCWDAGECRLRYAWRGTFIDASAHWRGKGAELAILPAEPWWSAPKGDFPIVRGDGGGPPQPASERPATAASGPTPQTSEKPARDAFDGTRSVRFLGYKIDLGSPEFRYRVGDTEVFEKISATPGDSGLVLHFRIPKAVKGIEFRLAPGNATLSSSVGSFVGGSLRLTPAQAADFTVTLTEPSRPPKAN